MSKRVMFFGILAVSIVIGMSVLALGVSSQESTLNDISFMVHFQENSLTIIVRDQDIPVGKQFSLSDLGFEYIEDGSDIENSPRHTLGSEPFLRANLPPDIKEATCVFIYVEDTESEIEPAPDGECSEVWRQNTYTTIAVSPENAFWRDSTGTYRTLLFSNTFTDQLCEPQGSPTICTVKFEHIGTPLPGGNGILNTNTGTLEPVYDYAYTPLSDGEFDTNRYVIEANAHAAAILISDCGTDSANQLERIPAIPISIAVDATCDEDALQLRFWAHNPRATSLAWVAWQVPLPSFGTSNLADCDTNSRINTINARVTVPRSNVRLGPSVEHYLHPTVRGRSEGSLIVINGKVNTFTYGLWYRATVEQGEFWIYSGNVQPFLENASANLVICDVPDGEIPALPPPLPDTDLDGFNDLIDNCVNDPTGINASECPETATGINEKTIEIDDRGVPLIVTGTQVPFNPTPFQTATPEPTATEEGSTIPDFVSESSFGVAHRGIDRRDEPDIGLVIGGYACGAVLPFDGYVVVGAYRWYRISTGAGWVRDTGVNIYSSETEAQNNPPSCSDATHTATTPIPTVDPTNPTQATLGPGTPPPPEPTVPPPPEPTVPPPPGNVSVTTRCANNSIIFTVQNNTSETVSYSFAGIQDSPGQLGPNTTSDVRTVSFSEIGNATVTLSAGNEIDSDSASTSASNC
ncbi:MAG: hypothetical protein AAFV98_02935 [Chloroflexota bacterium]